MNLPTEILQMILLALPQRTLAQCSYVNRTWYYSTRSPVLYHSIVIYSHSQLYKFIELATTLLIDGRLVGQWVRKVTISYPAETNTPSYEDLKALHLACPNIRYLSGHDLPYSTFAFPYMAYLTKSDDATDDDEFAEMGENSPAAMNMNIKIKDNREWLDRIYDIAVSLQMTVSPKDEDPMFYTRQDNRLRYHKNPLHHTIFDDVDPIPRFIEVLLEDQPLDFDFYGKILGFTRQFDTIKDLHLDFTPFTKNTSVSSFLLDERTLDAIHDSCPALESLSLYGFSMNYSAYSSNIRITENNITRDGTLYGDFGTTTPCNRLKSFQFHTTTVLRPECFKYLSKKYPQLRQLNLNIRWLRLFEEEKDIYINALFRMITGFERLKVLKLMDNLFCGQFPYERFFSWLATHPNRFESLGFFSTDAIDLENMYKDKMMYEWEDYEQEVKLRSHYLNYLSEISLKTITPFRTLRYFLRDCHTTIASTTITKLKLLGTDCRCSNFYIYEWMDAFPNLQELHVEKMCVTESNSSLMDTIPYESSTVTTLTTFKKKQYPKLEVLRFKSVFIKLRYQFNEICQMYPSLTSIALEDIGFVDYNMPFHILQIQPQTRQEKVSFLKRILKTPPKDEFILMDAPHLKLDRLFIQNIQYCDNNMRVYKKRLAPIKLEVNEKAYNNEINLESKAYAPSIKSIKINCHSVSVLVFEDENGQ
ncbi:unnamed protein product [Cunninghamella blakesleeana]